MSQQLFKLIQEGEHQQQDFKYCINDSKKIARSLVAFANTDGGRLLIGVKDNGNIAGVRSEEEYYMVEAAAKIYSDPPLDFTTKQWHIEGKTVLEIRIEPSQVKPHFAKDETGEWLAFIRKDDQNLQAHKIQLTVWNKLKKRQGIRFTYSDDEKFLVDYLTSNPSLTFSKFVRLAHISRQKAEKILSDFVLLNLIFISTTQEGTFFSLNPDFDKKLLAKFR